MKSELTVIKVSALSCWGVMAMFAIGLVILVMRLYEVQIEGADDFSDAAERQSERRVRTAGGRGRILDRHGKVLADVRTAQVIVCDASHFRRRKWSETERDIFAAITELGRVIGRASTLSPTDIHRHVMQSLARPLVAWRELDEDELARFCEHRFDFAGFSLQEVESREYPYGRLASHLIGYVGRAEAVADGGDGAVSFRELELRGREGLELYYDEYLRGVPGECRMVVDARGFAYAERTVVEAQRGPDLELTIAVDVQRSVERELAGERGACVVMDPRTGEILAMASAPDFNLADFTPVITAEIYDSLRNDPALPLLNRAVNGVYAPGSTFKPITALAGLSVGWELESRYECEGAYGDGEYRLRCSRRWGHGELDLGEALKYSCNPFFCNLGFLAGTNAVIAMARNFGLGERTGVDLPVDRAGVVPDAEFKSRVYHSQWQNSDLALMSIGQGMLLATPLQMARVAGALATGYLVKPHLWSKAAQEKCALPVPEKDLEAVRNGMFLVVNSEDGSGAAGGEGVAVTVCGKTGTAEVGPRDKRRKNTWFIAYAPAEAPTVAVAMVIENGVSGGGTTAPKVARILRKIFALAASGKGAQS